MSIRVVIADDHHFVRQHLTGFLTTDREIEVVGTANNGLEAVKVTRELNPDVVIMDLSMPGMDGLEATELIKRERPDIRVIVLTLSVYAILCNKALKAGAEICLEKGGDSNKLIQAIKGTGKRPQNAFSLN